jgi:YD repeat-containing protein
MESVCTGCLIARDEDAALRACLASAAKFCAEMILVEPGSTDRPAVAAALSAAAAAFPWRHHLATNVMAATDRNGHVRTFGYDAVNRTTAETWVGGGAGGANYTFSWNYDAAGRLSAASNPDSCKGTRQNQS